MAEKILHVISGIARPEIAIPKMIDALFCAMYEHKCSCRPGHLCSACRACQAMEFVDVKVIGKVEKFNPIADTKEDR